MYKRTFQLFTTMLACSLWANAQQTTEPTPPLPLQWEYGPMVEQTLPSDDRWWQLFDDPVLDSLIVMGEDANFDLAMAMDRMEAARQQVRLAKASYYPQFTINGGYERARQFGATTNTYSLTAGMSWEIDLFGRIGAQVKQEKALYRASRADYTAAMVSMAAEIARDYVELRVAQAQLQVAEAHQERQDTIAGLARTRFECGLAAKIDVDQAMTIVYSTGAGIPMLKSSIHSYINALALLTGRYAPDIAAMVDTPRPLPDYHRIITAGVPADLLRRRPDIVAAEAQLAAQAAAVGIAKKDFLPTLSLTGQVGVISHGHGKMFGSDNFAYSIAPTLSWTIFDGMARNARVAAAKADLRAQVESYNLTVMTACNEVDNAINAYINSLNTITLYQKAMESSAEFLQLSVDLYTQGLSDFTNVANAQSSYLEYANSAISSQGNALTYLIQLYQALGGGDIQ